MNNYSEVTISLEYTIINMPFEEYLKQHRYIAISLHSFNDDVIIKLLMRFGTLRTLIPDQYGEWFSKIKRIEEEIERLDMFEDYGYYKRLSKLNKQLEELYKGEKEEIHNLEQVHLLYTIGHPDYILYNNSDCKFAEFKSKADHIRREQIQWSIKWNKLNTNIPYCIIHSLMDNKQPSVGLSYCEQKWVKKPLLLPDFTI